MPADRRTCANPDCDRPVGKHDVCIWCTDRDTSRWWLTEEERSQPR